MNSEAASKGVVRVKDAPQKVDGCVNMLSELVSGMSGEISQVLAFA